LIIAANALAFVLELGGGEAFIYHWSLIPANIVAGRTWLTILTSLFMHAGWAHILGNMLFLWVFGPEIEDVMGPVRYLIFYLMIRTILLIFYFIRITLIPAVVLVGFWFLLQLFSEVGALATTQTGGVAYMAHIGGFIFGMVTARLFETRQRRAEQGLEE
jgi:membrane associated rhomboid family serine protease